MASRERGRERKTKWLESWRKWKTSTIRIFKCEIYFAGLKIGTFRSMWKGKKTSFLTLGRIEDILAAASSSLLLIIYNASIQLQAFKMLVIQLLIELYWTLINLVASRSRTRPQPVDACPDLDRHRPLQGPQHPHGHRRRRALAPHQQPERDQRVLG